jgi:magnesium and cobalt transporter
MKDEPPSTFSTFKKWLERARNALCFYPSDRQQLTQLLRKLEARNLIEPDTLTTLEGAMQASEMQVRDIMVPRAEMVVVEEDADPGDFLPILIESSHSRFPVMDEKRNQVVGILLAKDILSYLANPERGPFDLKDVIRPPLFVPESKRLNVLLREFRNSHSHMAIVVDEYGGVAGLVSIEDVIEQIVGEIEDEHDVADESYIKRHRQDQFIVKARTPVEDFNEYFHTAFQDDEYDTIGGLVLKAFGHLPVRRETIEAHGFRFEVLRADQRRIHLLRVTRLAAHALTHAAGSMAGANEA